MLDPWAGKAFQLSFEGPRIDPPAWSICFLSFFMIVSRMFNLPADNSLPLLLMAKPALQYGLPLSGLIPCPNLGPTVPQPKFAVRNMHVYKIAQYRTHTKFEIALFNTMKFSAVAIGLYDYPSLSLPALPNVKSFFFFFFFMFGFSFSVLQLLVCFTVFTVGGWHSFHTAAGHSDLQQP